MHDTWGFEHCSIGVMGDPLRLQAILSKISGQVFRSMAARVLVWKTHGHAGMCIAAMSVSIAYVRVVFLLRYDSTLALTRALK